jgi:hypothetical protein
MVNAVVVVRAAIVVKVVGYIEAEIVVRIVIAKVLDVVEVVGVVYVVKL